MELELYKAELQKLYEKANHLSAHNCCGLEDYQASLTAISVEAVKLYVSAVESYNKRSDYNNDDYRLRVNAFLDFDNHLKALKKQVAGKQNASGFFHLPDTTNEKQALLHNDNSSAARP